MTIAVTCECGKTLHAPATLAGKRGRCPGCGKALAIPAAAAAEEDYAPLIEPESAASREKAAPIPGYRPSSPTPEPTESQPDLGVIVGQITRLVVAAVAALLIVGGLWWWKSTAGTKFKILSVEVADALVAYDTLDVLSPYNLLTGSGTHALGTHVPGYLTMGTKIPGNTAAQDVAFTAGGSDQFLLTRKNPDGRHLVIRAAISANLINARKQTNRYSLVHHRDAFTLTPKGLSGPGAPVKGRLLYTEMPSGLEVDLSGAQTTNYQHLLPCGVEPTKETPEAQAQQGARGRIEFDGQHGVTGWVDYVSFFQASGNTPGVKGLSGQGRLEWKLAGQPPLRADYRGDLVRLEWEKDTRGWWAKETITMPEELGMFKKYPVILLFEKPATPAEKYELNYVGQRVATIRWRELGQPPAVVEPAPAQPPPKRSGGYLDMLAEARNKAKGVVSASNMTQIALSVQLYMTDHSGSFPPDFGALRRYEPALDAVLKNPRTGERHGYIYVKPADHVSELEDPSDTPMIYEAKGGNPDPDGAVIYADGHIEMP